MKNDVVELIQRCLSDDESAFAELVNKYKKQVHALAWRKTEDFHIAEDITQEVFLKVYQELHTLRDPNLFHGWLYVTTANCCIAWHRKKRIPAQHLEDKENIMSETDTYSQYVVEEKTKTAVESQREVVKKLLAKLGESERTVMTLHYLGEMTIEEISKFIGVSSGTIKSRLQRARNRLQKEEAMIREALEHFQIAPNLTDNVVKEVARLKPAAPTPSKPLVPWIFAASTLAVVLLMLGFGNHEYLMRYQKPYSLDADAVTIVEIVEAPITANFKSTPDVRLQIKSTDVVAMLNDSESQQNDDNAVSSEETQTDKTVRDYSQWELPVDAIARLGKGTIEDIAISADGRQLAVASYIGIWLYDTQTGGEIAFFNGHKTAVRSVAFSPDGVTLASGGGLGEDKSIRLWDTRTGEHKILFSGYRGDAGALAFSPDGKLLVGGDHSGNVRIWDMTTGERKHTLLGNTTQVLEVVFSPDGKTVTCASLDDTLRLWDVDTGQLKQTYVGHTNWILTVAFSPDGSVLASGSQDGTIRLWDVATGNLKKTITIHAEIDSITFSPDTIHAEIDSIAFSPDGNTLASGSHLDRNIQLWNVSTGQQEKVITPPNFGVAKVLYSPDRKTLIGMNPGGKVHFMDLETGTNKFSIEGYLSSIDVVEFAPDSKTLASTTGFRIVLWDIDTRKQKSTLVRKLKSDIALISSIAFSPDNRTLASADRNGNIDLWDLTSGEHIQTRKSHAEGISSIAYSYDGKKFASAGGDGTVRIWDALTGEQVHILEEEAGPVISVAFSPDNLTLASSSQNGVVRLWNVENGKRKLTIPKKGNGDSVAFSTTGVLLATADKSVSLWHTKTGEEVLNLDPFSPEQIKQHLQLAAGDPEKMLEFNNRMMDMARIVEFSSDGKKLAVLGSNDAIRLWDIETQSIIKSFAGHKQEILSMDFSPDGKTIATGSADGSILLWKVK